jgi:MFS family permease
MSTTNPKLPSSFPPHDRAASNGSATASLPTTSPQIEVTDTKPGGALSAPGTNDALPTPYTVFNGNEKGLLTIILAFAMLASPLTATIYLPLLPLLAIHFQVSIQDINLTITLYIIFQAIAPLIFATASDSLGRRPIYLITYAIYTAASLGLALNRTSYIALLVLRALQSLGASAVLAVAYGVVADVSPPANRGAMIGPIMAAANLAVCIGPVIGGWVALGSGGYEWVFWCLVIFGGTVLWVVGWAFPETARSLVGNGSLKATGLSRTWWSVLTERIKKRVGNIKDTGEQDSKDSTDSTDKAEPKHESLGKKFKVANPLAAIRILFWKDTALVLWIAASPYAVYYCIQASIPTIYNDIYGFNELQIGLSYLTGGVGVVLGGYLNGKMMDNNYKVTAKSIGHTVNKVSGDDLTHFPIEQARARGSWYLLLSYSCALAGYGWAVQNHAHVSIPLILQFVLAVLCTSFQQTFNTLLVDIFPASPSTAAASSNITRCALSAAMVAVMQPLVQCMGRGWYFTLLTVLSGGGGFVAAWFIKRKGMGWRRKRISKTSVPTSH